MKLLIIYLSLVNVLGFILMTVDKIKAKKKLWRIPEFTLLAVAVVGGSVGVALGMNLMWHKINHLKFTIGLPFIIAVQALLLVYLAGKVL